MQSGDDNKQTGGHEWCKDLEKDKTKPNQIKVAEILFQDKNKCLI